MPTTVQTSARQREFLAAAAWPLDGEPGALDLASIVALETDQSPTTHACNSDTHDGITMSAGTTFPLSDLAVIPQTVLGPSSSEASLPPLRVGIGAQDLVGNIYKWTPMNCQAVRILRLRGQVSDLDSGNTDLEAYSFDGLRPTAFGSGFISEPVNRLLPAQSSPGISPQPWDSPRGERRRVCSASGCSGQGSSSTAA